MQRTWLGPLAAATGLLLLAAAPALAQSVPSEGDASVVAGTNPLPASKPLPTIKTGISRDISLDTPPTAAAYGTMTKSADGTETSTPPSAALVALVSGESGPVAAGAAPPQKLGPPAALVPIGNAGVYPYRAVGLLTVHYGANSYPCTGTLIGPATVMTDAGCLWGAEGNPVWADTAEFSPGAQNGNAPYGTIEAADMNIMQEFADALTTTTTFGPTPYSIGIVTLQSPIGSKVGWLGYETDPNKSYTPTGFAYGQDGKEPALASTTCPIDQATMVRSEAKAAPCVAGEWGTPLFLLDAKGARYVTGMVDAGAADGSPLRFVARMSAVTYQWISDLRK